MQDSIIGYLLGALDDDEMAQFEAQLKRDPELQARVRDAARSLEFLRQDPDDIEPPPGLAESTCSLIEEFRPSRKKQRVNHAGTSRTGNPFRLAGGPAANEDSWTLADMLVACSVVLAGCLLLFPAINNSRYHAQIVGCQNNLRSIGRALIEYSLTDPNEYFPQVPETGNLAFAGMHAPTLKELGLIETDSLFMCAASPRPQPEQFRVPLPHELEKAKGAALRVAQRSAGGDYGYPLGFQENGRVKPIRNQSRNSFALMSDSPTIYKILCVSAAKKRDVHRNVLFESGRVRIICVQTDCWCGDQLFTNDLGEVSAGMHEEDAVIAPSGVAPISRMARYTTQ